MVLNIRRLQEIKDQARSRMVVLSPSGILIFKLSYFFSLQTLLMGGCGADKDKSKMPVSEKRKSDEGEQMKDLKKVSHGN